jgi:hypothetical protein
LRGRIYASGFPGGLRRINLDGSGEELLTGGPSNFFPMDLDVAAGMLYGIGPAGIARVNTDGTNYEVILNESILPLGGMSIDVVGGKLYYISGHSEIRRSNLDGTSDETVVEDLFGSSEFGALTVDSKRGRIYWWQWIFDGQSAPRSYIRSATLAGTGVADVVVVEERVLDMDMDVDGQVLYWTVHGDGTYSYELSARKPPRKISADGDFLDFVPRERLKSESRCNPDMDVVSDSPAIRERRRGRCR